MRLSSFFRVWTEPGTEPNCELVAFEATAVEAGVRLILDGYVYGLRGEGDFPVELEPPELARRLLQSYLRRPEGFFERVNGQCSITLVERNKVSSFRSRLCPSQIYYSPRGLSNHLAPLFQAEGRPALSRDYFLDFIWEAPGLQYDSPQTPFVLLRRLEPGGRLELGADGARVTRPAPPASREYRRRPGQKLEEAAEQVRELLGRAVDTRLGDRRRPVTCQLSGGLDSSFITALVAERVPKLASCYMLSESKLPSHRTSEDHARAVANELGTALTVVPPEEVPASDISSPVSYADEPCVFFWQDALFSPLESRLVGERGLLFSGFGADQIFMREPTVIVQLFRQGDWKDFWGSLSDCASDQDRSRAHLLWQSLLLALPRNWYERLSASSSGWRFNPFAAQEMDPKWCLEEPIDWLKASRPKARRADDRELDFSYLSVPYFSGDAALEAFGARGAHPFCDSRLIDYVIDEVSWNWIHDWSTPYKNLLREAQKGLVPESVRRRGANEFGFDAYLTRFLKQNDVYLRELLHSLELPLDVGLSGPDASRALEALLYGVSTQSTEKLLSLLGFLVWWRDFQSISL